MISVPGTVKLLALNTAMIWFEKLLGDSDWSRGSVGPTIVHSTLSLPVSTARLTCKKINHSKIASILTIPGYIFTF